MQASIFGACPKPGKSWRVAAGRASVIKMGGGDGVGSLISPGEVALIGMVGVSASDMFLCRRFLLAPAHLGSPGKEP